jgi:dTDP-4-dehydrorhamnose reductase
MQRTAKILVTGANGMLGRDLVALLADSRVTALGRQELDIRDADAADASVAGHDVVVNCAAFTRVDEAESKSDDAFAVNAAGAGNLAAAAARHGATLVHVSTDYVFDGTSSVPYAEDSPMRPLSVYGRSKAEGERRAVSLNPGRTIVVRTAWLYGENGPSFPATMLRLAHQGSSIRVVDDQFGQPTWTRDVAHHIARLLESGIHSGTFHATNSGATSRFEFARAILQLGGFDTDILIPIPSTQLVERAARPRYSVLGHDAWSAAGLTPMRDWRSALAEAMEQGALTTP